MGISSIDNKNKNNGGKQSDPATIGLAIQSGVFKTAVSGAATVWGFELQNIVNQGNGKDSNSNSNINRENVITPIKWFDYIFGLIDGHLSIVSYCFASNNIKTNKLFWSYRVISNFTKVITKDLKRFSSKKSFLNIM